MSRLFVALTLLVAGLPTLGFASPETDRAVALLTGADCADKVELHGVCPEADPGAAFSSFGEIYQRAFGMRLPRGYGSQISTFQFARAQGNRAPRTDEGARAAAAELGGQMAARLREARDMLVAAAAQVPALQGEAGAREYAAVVEAVTLFNHVRDFGARHTLGDHQGKNATPLLGGQGAPEALPFPPVPTGTRDSTAPWMSESVQAQTRYLERVAYWVSKLSCDSTRNYGYDEGLNHFTRVDYFQSFADVGQGFQYADDGVTEFYQEMSLDVVRSAMRFKAAQNAFRAYVAATGAGAELPELALQDQTWDTQASEFTGFKFPSAAQNYQWMKSVRIRYSQIEGRRNFYLLANYNDFDTVHVYHAAPATQLLRTTTGTIPDFQGLLGGLD